MKVIYHFKPQHKLKQIGPIVSRRVNKKGVQDGGSGLLRQDDSGLWTSPYILREICAFQEFCKREWLLLEQSTSELSVKAEALRMKIIRLKNKRQSMAGKADVRFKGEEKLEAWIVSGRRNKEFAELDRLEDEYHDIVQNIIEAENSVRLFCLHVQEHTFGRLSIYWHGCLESSNNPSLPPVPPIVISSDAETAYMKRHNRNLDPASVAENDLEKEQKNA